MRRLHVGSIGAVLFGMAIAGCSSDEPSAVGSGGSHSGGKSGAGGGGKGGADGAVPSGGVAGTAGAAGSAGNAGSGGAVALTCPPAGRDPALVRYISPSGGGNGLSEGAPYQMADFINEADAGFTGCLLDGVYQGPASMITHPPRSGSAGNSCGPSGTGACDIMVMAMSDGGAFIDGEFVNTPISIQDNSYWTFQGFDVGNGDGVVFSWSTTGAENNNLVFRRICASNNLVTIPGQNGHVWSINYMHNVLFEDICGFGTGRTTITEAFGSSDLIYRRVWLRFEGNPPTYNGDGVYCHATPIYQYAYGIVGPVTTENMITVYDPEQYNLAT